MMPASLARCLVTTRLDDEVVGLVLAVFIHRASQRNGCVGLSTAGEAPVQEDAP